MKSFPPESMLDTFTWTLLVVGKVTELTLDLVSFAFELAKVPAVPVGLPQPRELEQL